MHPLKIVPIGNACGSEHDVTRRQLLDRGARAALAAGVLSQAEWLAACGGSPPEGRWRDVLGEGEHGGGEAVPFTAHGIALLERAG